MLENVKTILVPVDFSDNAKIIVGAARNVAEKFGAELSLVFVVQSFEDYSGFFVPHMPIEQFQSDMVGSAERRMEMFVEDHFGDPDGCRWTVAIGDVGEGIVAQARKEGADLIIMGTHGYKGIERALFGSVAEMVVKHAPCPVLTVNPYQKD